MGGGQGALSHIYDRIQVLDQLQQWLGRRWPELIKAGARAIVLQRGTLILAAPRLGDVVRIRHALPEIMHGLEQEVALTHLKIKKIKMIQQPKDAHQPEPQHPTQSSVLPPSEAGLAKLEALGQSCRHPGLQQAFESLTQKLRQLNR